MTVKDEALAGLAEKANVAQFVSFGPGPEPAQRYARMAGEPFDPPFASVEEAVATLLDRASHRTVNVRTFQVGDATSDGKGHDFHYGLEVVDDVAALVRVHAAEGRHTIVNETIPVDDGGVSGVALGDSLEFSPDDTPRCVERPGTVGLPRDIGIRLLQTVYGVWPELDAGSDERLEWSLHPRRVGLRQRHTLVWELEHVGEVDVDVQLTWPNNFSRLLGDKTFGLLVADQLGAPVPRTMVVPRRVAPFTFGQPTGAGERWLRTAPREPVPGHYSTFPEWRDPFVLLSEEDPHGEVAAVLAQDAVDARYAGALGRDESGERIIEGVAGRGDDFMLGRDAPVTLPREVSKAVAGLADDLERRVGPLRLEWAVDDATVWVLQLQQAPSGSRSATLVGGEVRRWRTFDVDDGLPALRALVDEVRDTGEGIVLRGNVGLTSHFGDVVRRAGVPTRLELRPA